MQFFSFVPRKKELENFQFAITSILALTIKFNKKIKRMLKLISLTIQYPGPKLYLFEIKFKVKVVSYQFLSQFNSQSKKSQKSLKIQMKIKLQFLFYLTLKTGYILNMIIFIKIDS